MRMPRLPWSGGGMVLLLGLMLSGCDTLHGPARPTGVPPEEIARQYLRQDVDRLKALAEESREHRRQQDLRLERLSQDLPSQQQALRQQVDALQREIQALQADREVLRRQVVDEISARIERMLAAQGPARTASAAAGGARTQTGYEHVVGAGQTLSEIAAAYGVTVDAIVKANKLQDPNRLRLGQKLFIPE